MKKKIQYIGFAIAVILFYMVSCNEDDNIDPDEPVNAGPSDSLSYEYYMWYDTNMNHAIFETGPSAFIFLNNPGTVDETKQFTLLDTAIEISRRYLDMDTARFYQLDSYPGTSAAFKSVVPHIACNGSQKETNAWVKFPTSICRKNGTKVGNEPIEVVDNQVSVLGISFSVDDPSTFGPPSLASLLAHSIHNPPSPPTSAQINNLPCEEIVGSYFNCREIHILIEKNYSWSVSGVYYYRQIIYIFGFSHFWYYECPDGPLERGMICDIRASNKLWKDGTLSKNYSREAIHYHKY